MHEEQGPDDMKSEFPSHIEECFYSSLEGAYFKRELTKARDEKRIGLPVPYDPSRLVNTFWDIGMNDENCIWFHQTDGVRHRLIGLYRNSGEGQPTYIQMTAIACDNDVTDKMLEIPLPSQERWRRDPPQTVRKKQHE